MIPIILGTLLVCNSEGACHTESKLFPDELTCVGESLTFSDYIHETNKSLPQVKRWTILELDCKEYTLKIGEQL